MKFKKWFDKLEQYVDHWWYPPLLGFIAFIDYFILLIPLDALVLTAGVLAPKRWLSIGLSVGLGSTLGATALVAVLENNGLPLFLHHFPVNHTHTWQFSEQLMQHYGSWAIWFVGLGPFFQHPILVLAAMGKMPLAKFCLLMLAGRVPKYCFYTWGAVHILAFFERKKKAHGNP